VDRVVEEKDAVVEKAAVSEEQSVTEIDVVGLLHDEVWERLEKRVGAIAEALVNGSAQGQVQLLKILLEMVDEIRKKHAAGVKRIERSLADEWGAEPEWRDGCCVFCGRSDGICLESAA
jgi:hypothetical protein